MAIQAPPAEIIRPFYHVLVPFVNRVVTLLQEFPDLRPTSWWRSNVDNQRAGGSPESQHRVALAADLDWQLVRSPHAVVASRARQLGLIPVSYSRHVHVQLFPAGALARAGVRFDLLA